MNTYVSISLILNFILILTAIIIVVRKGGVRYLSTKISNINNQHQQSYDYIFPAYYTHKNSQFATLAKPSQQIILLGDSITDEGEWVELLANPDVLNRGISGDTTVRVTKRLSAIIQSQPRQLFLLIGVNDLINTPKTIPEIVRDYRQLVQELTAKLTNTEIFLQSILPVNNQIFRLWPDNHKILTLNQNIQAIATELNCQYIDIYPHLTDGQNQLDSRYTNDGVHLNGDAYVIWAKILKAYLK